MMSYQAPLEFGPMVVRNGKINQWLVPTVCFSHGLLFYGVYRLGIARVPAESHLIFWGGLLLLGCLSCAFTLMVLERMPAFGSQFLIFPNGFLRIDKSGKQVIRFEDVLDFSHRVEDVPLGRRQAMHHLRIRTEKGELYEAIQVRLGSLRWSGFHGHANTYLGELQWRRSNSMGDR